MLIFGFEFWQVACVIACVVGAVLLVRFLFSKDDEIEDRRRRAMKAAAELRKIKDDQTAAVLEAYAIGDYSGIIKVVSDIIDKLMEPAGVIDMRADMVFTLLPELLKGDKYDARLRKVIAQAIRDEEFTLEAVSNNGGDNVATSVTAR